MVVHKGLFVVHRGFSLVELSIVLVILGLITGGILSGKSLIRAAELRSVVTEYQHHLTAVSMFQDQYEAIPGDFNDATRFWGKNNTSCAAHTGTAASPGTCNGGGDGYVQQATVAGGISEAVGFWQHLANAGLIEGAYGIVVGGGGQQGITSVSRVRTLRSRMPGGMWRIVVFWLAAQNIMA